jgi:hypothetical protein
LVYKPGQRHAISASPATPGDDIVIDVLNLALPYLGLIFLGFACGRLQDIPHDAWVEPASVSVLLGTLVSVATLTTVMWLVQRGV